MNSAAISVLAESGLHGEALFGTGADAAMILIEHIDRLEDLDSAT